MSAADVGVLLASPPYTLEKRAAADTKSAHDDEGHRDD